MKLYASIAALALAAGVPSIWHSRPAPAPSTAAVMQAAATSLLASLDEQQRAACQFDYEPERVEQWHFIPMEERAGLPYKKMRPHQLRLAEALVASGLSAAGYLKVKTIMSLEQVLFDVESARGGRIARLRDPDLYYLAIYGEPGEAGPWGWRIEGHHVSLHFTLAQGRLIATTPAFLGANPHRVTEGSLAGIRPLGAEEDLARGLLDSLTPQQRAASIVAPEAPRDIFTSNARRVAFTDVPSEGLPVRQLSREQRRVFDQLVGVYVDNVDGAEAAYRRSRVEQAGERITFAWMGSGARGEPHYYRVHGATFLIEYDNLQSGANHSHTVWRDYANDFGRDWLAEHHRTGH